MIERETIQAFLQDQHVEDLVQLNALLKEMTGVLVEELLEAERDDHLGYTKYDNQNKQKTDATGIPRSRCIRPKVPWR